MRYEMVKTGSIVKHGANAGRFSFSFQPRTDDLEDSIRRMGLVNPPVLRRRGDILEVVCGFKRVLACVDLGLDRIGAIVHGADELPDEKCLWFSLIDSGAAGSMSPVECSIALEKFSAHGYDTGRLVREVAPRLGIPASPKYIENCLNLFLLEGEILRAIHQGAFGIEQAFCLYQLEADTRSVVFGILLSCRANLNETRELISLILDAAVLAGMSAAAYASTHLGPMVNDASLPPRKRLECVRDHLRRSVYPRMVKAESAFKTIVDEMNLGRRCSISAPRYFEGDEISVSAKAGTVEELLHMLKGLSSSEAEDKFRRLFSIIRGGDTS